VATARMKLFKIGLYSLLAVAICLACGAWTTDDYGLSCAKCLEKKHVVEQRFLGIQLSRRTRDRKPPGDYERVFGHSCEHVFRKGGFGRSRRSIGGSSIGCGTTSEGIFIRPRMQAVAAAYDAEQRLHERDLALETLQLVDTLMPPDFPLERRREMTDVTHSTLWMLGSYLGKVETSGQWRAVLDAARDGFKDVSSLSEP
jgi:hypothetical protein